MHRDGLHKGMGGAAAPRRLAAREVSAASAAPPARSVGALVGCARRLAVSRGPKLLQRPGGRAAAGIPQMPARGGPGGGARRPARGRPRK